MRHVVGGATCSETDKILCICNHGETPPTPTGKSRPSPFILMVKTSLTNAKIFSQQVQWISVHRAGLGTQAAEREHHHKGSVLCAEQKRFGVRHEPSHVHVHNMWRKFHRLQVRFSLVFCVC